MYNLSWRCSVGIPVFVLMCLITFARTESAGASQIVLDETFRHMVVREGIECLVETEPLDRYRVTRPEFADRWHPFDGKVLNSGTSPPTTWFRFDLHARAPAKGTWLLEIGWPLLDRVELSVFFPETGTWGALQTAGNSAPLAGKAVRHYTALFPLDLTVGQKATVYARIATRTPLFLSFELWQSRALLHHDRYHTFWMGLFFGVLAVMVLYNLCLYVFVRDRSYLAYSVYILAVILYELASTGIGGRYVWESAPWLQAGGYYLFAAMSFLAATLFIRLLLRLKEYGGWVYHLNNLFLGYWGLATASCVLLPFSPISQSMQLAALLSPPAGMVTGIYLWCKGNVQAKYYTIANFVLNLGTLTLMLGLSGVFEHNGLTEYSQMVGFGFEAVLLSLALADRINRERASREAAQAEALQLSQKVGQERAAKLQAQDQLLAVQKQTNEELELRVLDRTNELERTMKSLELANEALSELSYTDPLTKVHNRRYFDQVLAGELKRANRTRQHLSLLLFDIDHFKAINDTHGHLIGDDCLRLVAKALQSQMQREGDFLARYGGEEFAAVLPATDAEKAVVVAERARLAVENIEFIHKGERLLLRVSIGVSGWLPSQDEAADRLIAAADKALYQAKESGRNRSVLAA